MSLQELWQGVRRGYQSVNAFLEQFYRLGPAAHGVQGVLRELLEGPSDGVRLTWREGRPGPICEARDDRGSYRIELSQEGGHWSVRSCSCLGFQEFRRDCRHLRATRAALASRDRKGSAQA